MEEEAGPSPAPGLECERCFSAAAALSCPRGELMWCAVLSLKGSGPGPGPGPGPGSLGEAWERGSNPSPVLLGEAKLICLRAHAPWL